VQLSAHRSTFNHTIPRSLARILRRQHRSLLLVTGNPCVNSGSTLTSEICRVAASRFDPTTRPFTSFVNDADRYAGPVFEHPGGCNPPCMKQSHTRGYAVRYPQTRPTTVCSSLRVWIVWLEPVRCPFRATRSTINCTGHSAPTSIDVY
jgi:hypothetical protein